MTEVIRATSGLNINRIGIDLGAWIQVYPIRDTAEELSEGRIWAEAIHAARRTRRDIYEEDHNRVLPAKSKSLLPDSRADVDLTAPPSLPASTDSLEEIDFHEARPGFQYDFFQDDGGWEHYDVNDDELSRGHTHCAIEEEEDSHHQLLVDYLIETKVNTLPTMLVKLHDVWVSSYGHENRINFIRWNLNGKLKARIRSILPL
jgi:hypothetical protein